MEVGQGEIELEQKKRIIFNGLDSSASVPQHILCCCYYYYYCQIILEYPPSFILTGLAYVRHSVSHFFHFLQKLWPLRGKKALAPVCWLFVAEFFLLLPFLGLLYPPLVLFDSRPERKRNSGALERIDRHGKSQPGNDCRSQNMFLFFV